jgi:hypothetical protein
VESVIRSYPALIVDRDALRGIAESDSDRIVKAENTMITPKETQEYLSRALPLSDPRAWVGIVIILAGLAVLIHWGVWS